MKRNQSGFTLIEIAIVLVIIGLLLGGVMKGQELINSAKVKNLAADFKNTSLYIYSYQDKFRSLPGDDALVSSHLTGATAAASSVGGVQTIGNGRVDGFWDKFDSAADTSESYLFWQHVRLAGLATGVTTLTDTTGAYPPRNTLGGIIGITNSTDANNPISGLRGAYIICSANIQGKFAKQLDIMLDDGVGNTGSLQTQGPAPGSTAAGTLTVGAAPLVNANIDDTTLYTVCMGV
ncbi:MAG: prepilin-type N-terminal cleavage/methylation domain-containing protein [Sideroxyarcus sp.]|nr:prepilin-type N-terminal cleavage/methylation domain-containing protein [Sideroxyarcus sp.]